MSSELQTEAPCGLDSKSVERAADLLSQQIWCWGQDIVRPDGNWLIEVGFGRTAAPADREGCSSVYTLEMPHGRRVVLRGFGVFYGDDRLGGVFLQRYEFRPRYTAIAELESPLWSSVDLPAFSAPNESERDRASFLTIDLIDWVRDYEANVAERLGIDYRQATLDKWKRNKRPLIPAGEMANSWRTLGLAVAANPRALGV